MTRLRPTAAVLSVLALASCATTTGSVPAPSPEPGDAPGAEEGRPVDRPYVYRVAPEQAADPTGADTVSTLEVSGSAEVRVPADQARITFAVETEDSTARGAAAENARRMAAAIAALRDAGVEGLEIETRGYQLQPRYRRPGPEQRVTPEIDGYRARNLVDVTVPDVQAVGRLIDAAVGAGANRVASLAFEATDTEEARLRALREAVRRARGQAEAVAGALGLELGRALQVQTGASFPEPVVRFRAEAMAAQAPDTPVEPGEQTVSATVTIRYALEDG